MARKLTYEELEQKVKELDERLQGVEIQQLWNLYSQSPIPTLILSKEGKIEQYNDAMAQLTGYAHEEVPDVTAWMPKLYPDIEYRNKVIEISRKSRHREIDVKRDEFTITTKTGEKRHVQFSVYDIFHAGKPTDVQIVQGEDISKRKKAEQALQKAHDELERRVDERTAELAKANEGLEAEIAERKRVQEALQESEKWHRLLLSSITDGCWVLDREWRYTLVNEAGARLVNMSPDQLLGRKLTAIFPGVENTEFFAAYERSMREGTVESVAAPFALPDGREGIYEVRVYPVPDGILCIGRDTTQQVRAEESLRESEENYRNLADSITDVFFALDGDLKYTYWNKASERLTGVSAKDAIGKQVLEIFPDNEETRRALEVYQEVLKTQRPQSFVSEYHLGGERYFFEISAYHSANGLSVFVKDITEKKRKDEALRQSEERYRAIFEQAAESIVLVDAETGELVEFNEMAHENLGFTREEFTKLKIPDFEIIESAEEVAKHIKKIIKEGADTFETKHRTKSGEIRDIHVKTRSISIGGKNFAQSIWRDVSEIKRAQEALRESEERFRALTENTSDWIWEVDQNAIYTYASPKVKDLLGYELEEVIGKTLFDFMPPDEAERVGGLFRDIVDSREPFRGLENTNLHKDGRDVVLETSGVPILDAAGNLIGYRGMDRDISERKQAQEEKEKLQAQLQRAQTMETVGTLAGGVAHDLNNILSGIVSYPDLLLMQLPEDSPLRKPISTIQKSGEKAAAIVQDLLTLARRGVTVTEVVSLNLIISEYVKSPEHEKLISFHPNVHVRANLEADLLNILGSPAHLSKTVMNLVSNAAEAMTEGGTISISTENRYIDRPIRGYDHVEEGDYVLLTVSDTGVGMSSTDMERIFEPFYTKKVMGRSGTGLGMAVVWGTVKDHKGYIDIQSTEGKGTTFTLYFPITRKEVAKDKALISVEDYKGKGESILVVDDVEEQREIATEILKELGYSVKTVSSGEEAVDYLKNNSADLLLLDMIMDPGIDGLETYKRIIELHPKQKALIVSGFSETDRVKEAQRLGAGAYVKKPFLLEKIGLAIRAELDK